MFTTPPSGVFDRPPQDRQEPSGRAHDRVCRAWLGEPCGCSRPRFIYQEDGAPLMRVGTEAPEDRP